MIKLYVTEWAIRVIGPSLPTSTGWMIHRDDERAIAHRLSNAWAETAAAVVERAAFRGVEQPPLGAARHEWGSDAGAGAGSIGEPDGSVTFRDGATTLQARLRSFDHLPESGRVGVALVYLRVTRR